MNLHLQARTYKGKKFETVHLVVTENDSFHALMWGEMLPGVVDALAERLGLKVEREHIEMTVGPKCVPGCVPVHEQATLFNT